MNIEQALDFTTGTKLVKQRATLKHWREIKTEQSHCLVGEVYGHPKLEDGWSIRTSTIVKWIDDNTVETINTVYTLEDQCI